MTCATGATALKRLGGGERLDVLIFGYKLPDTTGIEWTRQTRALAHRQRTPIIMLTDYDVEEDALRAGATTFMRRSGAPAEITETVARQLARSNRLEGMGVRLLALIR